jgi:hypothetical protein
MQGREWNQRIAFQTHSLPPKPDALFKASLPTLLLSLSHKTLPSGCGVRRTLFLLSTYYPWFHAPSATFEMDFSKAGNTMRRGLGFS